jgi:hypothetical protein
MTFAHILYAALFRLAIIAAGISCVTMGYRLFVLGVMPKDGSQIDASTGEIRLSLKNAAPGTCFAAFGVFMIIVMLVQGIPEMKVIEVPTKNGIRREVTWRSDDEDIYTALMEGQKLERNDLLDKAIKAYAKPFNDGHLSLKEAAAPLRSNCRRLYETGAS